MARSISAAASHVDRAHLESERCARAPGSRRTARCRPALSASRKHATRVTPGAISLSSSSHFAAELVFELRKPGGVAARSRQAVDEAGADRIGDAREHDRHGAGRLCNGARSRLPRPDDVRRERHQIRPLVAAADRHRRRAQRYRSAHCGRQSSPVAASPCKRRDAACASGSSAAVASSTPMRRTRSAAARAPRAAKRRRAADNTDEIPVASCPPLGSGGSIVSAQTSALIGAETGFATAT